MCGIAAVIGSTEAPHRLSSIERLAGLLAHRGDQPVEWRVYPGAALGCARLAIVGGAQAAQPFEAGSLAIAYNGEIYNYRELKRDLERDGVRFISDGDTEVVLRAFETWGPAALDRFEGMYAFVIVDTAKRTFFAARDPFGIKPLYYARAGSEWFFSSEIYPLVSEGLADIAPFPAGGFCDNGRISDRVRYPALAPKSPDNRTWQAAAAEFKTLFASSVRRHMPSGDLPVAVFCSGGIDSSAVLYEAVQACHAEGWKPRDKIRVYSIGTATSEDPRFARALAASLDVPFVFVEVSVDRMVEDVGSTIATIESFEPNHIRAGATSLALARRVSTDGYKVALVGEGADELLGGYEEFPTALRNSGVADVERLLDTFSRQLHCTQLRRVDRTTMAFGVEARVPFLDAPLVEFVRRTPTEFKVHRKANGQIVGKHLLREAYRGKLPDEIVDRRKVPMGEGAGVGDNRPAGAFYQFAEETLSDGQLSLLQQRHVTFKLRNKEEAYYFSLFQRRFGELALAADRPMTNAIPTT